MLNISGIVASKYAAGRVSVTVDGHFNDDYHAYVFVSEDFGQSWRAITAGLPETSVHRIRGEHPSQGGTPGGRHGDGGLCRRSIAAEHWTSLNTNLPPVPVYDLLFQEGSKALVLGTHGRSIWVMDHDEPLAEIVAGNRGKGISVSHSAVYIITFSTMASSGSATANFSRRIRRRARW